MRTTFEIVTNSFANGYIRESVFYLAKCGISTGSYFKHGFPQHQCAGIRCCIGASLIVDKCLQYCLLQQFIRDIYR